MKSKYLALPIITLGLMVPQNMIAKNLRDLSYGDLENLLNSNRTTTFERKVEDYSFRYFKGTKEFQERIRYCKLSKIYFKQPESSAVLNKECHISIKYGNKKFGDNKNDTLISINYPNKIGIHILSEIILFKQELKDINGKIKLIGKMKLKSEFDVKDLKHPTDYNKWFGRNYNYLSVLRDSFQATIELEKSNK